MTQTSASRGPWLSASAIWAITGASALLNAWGWMQSAAGLAAILLVVLAISAEVLGVRLAISIEALADRKQRARLAVAVALMIGVVGFNAYSGKRALALIEQERLAPYAQAQAKRAEAASDVAAVKAAIAAVPTLPANVPASRLEAYRAARDSELARLQPQLGAAQAKLEALPAVTAPAPPIDPAVMFAVVVLIEALKALGLWALGSAPKAPAVPAAAPAAVSAHPGRDLARKRWDREAS